MTAPAGIETDLLAVRPTVSRRKRSQARNKLVAFLFVVPYLLFFVAFQLWPILYALWISLRNWQTIAGDQGFVGLLHYHTLLFNWNFGITQQFWEALRNTFLWALISVPLLVIFALIAALLLAYGPWRAFFRTVLYVPAVLSVTVAMTIWLWIFQNGGILSSYLHQNIPWLISQPWAWLTIFIATLWWTPGFNIIVLMVGILDVPNDYHEAARIDGASAFERLWYITLPLLRPILAFVTITQMIHSFGLFGQPFILTQGGPGASTTSVALIMYNEAFGPDNNLALAATMSFLVGLVLVVLAIIQLRVFRLGER